MSVYKSTENKDLCKRPAISAPRRTAGALTANNSRGTNLRPPVNTTILHALCVLVNLLIWTTLVALAQDLPASQESIRQDPTSAASLPTSTDVMALHALVEQWTAKAQVPQAEQLERSLRVRDVAGVQVTLRWGGMFMGRGQAFVESLTPKTSDLQRNEQNVDLVELARQAADAALQQVRTALQASFQNTTRQSEHSIPPNPVLEQISPRFCVDLQVARTPVLLPVDADVDVATLSRHVAADYHGLVLTTAAAAPTAWTWLWPADAIASNASLQAQLMQLRAQAGLPVLPRTRAGGGASAHHALDKIKLARFEVIHVVRPTFDQDATELIRGNPPMSETIVSEAQLEKLACQLTDYLLRRTRADGSVSGTYRPSSDRFESDQASPAEAALTAYALVRRASYLRRQAVQRAPDSPAPLGESASNGTEPPAPDTAEQPRKADQAQLCIRTAGRILNRLLNSTGPSAQGSTANIATSALIVLCLAEAPQLSDRKDQIPRLLDGLSQQARQWCLEGTDRSTTGTDDLAAGLTASGPQSRQNRAGFPTRALVLASLTVGYDQSHDPDLLDLASRLADRLSQDRARQDPAALPWLMLAEVRLRQFGAARAANQSDDRFASLVKTLANLRRHQVRPGSQSGPADVVGGIDWRADPSASPALPDWRSAHVLTAWATLLTQPQMTEPHQQAGWLLDCALAGTFLQRLTFQPAHCFYVRSPADVLGGVRLAFWDNRLAAGPSAMSLLATTQLQEALQQMRSILLPGQQTLDAGS